MTCFRMPTGESVHRFCKENGYSYSVFFYAIDNGADLRQAIELAKTAKEDGKVRPKYYYKGRPVVEIFGYHTPSYYRFRSDLKKGRPVDVAVELELKRKPSLYQSNSTKFFYQGMPLIKYLNDKPTYQRVLRRIRKGMKMDHALLLEGV